MTHDLAISSGTVVTSEHDSFAADVAVDGETISTVAAPGTPSGEAEIDTMGKRVLLGAIDPYTHHGIYRGLEADAESEPKSDLIGGVTTIGNYFRRAGAYRDIMPGYFGEAEPNYYHDYLFSLGLFSVEHVEEIPTTIEEFDIMTFKWYMDHKDAAREKFGVDCDMRDDFGDAFVRKLAEQDVPTTLGYHSENVEITNTLAGGNVYVTSESDDTDADADEGYEVMVEEFPGYAETQSTVAGTALAKVHGYDGHFYAVHVSAGETADKLATLHDAGYRTWGETYIHYLALTTKECDECMKVNPPVRLKADQETFWRHLANGTVSTIGTGHCANLAENKFGEGIRDSLLGLPSTPATLPLILSEGVNEGRISLERAVEVTSTNAAKAFNLYPRRGTVRVGSDADLAVVNLDETGTVMPKLLHSVSGYFPYEGRAVTGWPTQTAVKSELAYDDGDIVGTKGYGTHTDRPA